MSFYYSTCVRSHFRAKQLDNISFMIQHAVLPKHYILSSAMDVWLRRQQLALPLGEPQSGTRAGHVY